MSYEFYKVLHLIGIFLLLLALGGIGYHVITGGTRDFAGRKWFAILHGVALVITLVAGFGLLGRLELMTSMPAWAITKILIWLWMGVAPTLLYRHRQIAKPLWLTIFLLASASAWLAVFKPF